MDSIYQLLNNYYYNVKYPQSYQSVYKLYKGVSKIDPTITLEIVKKMDSQANNLCYSQTF